MDQIKVFLDSDVVISAMLSSKGASFEIIKNLQIKKIISKAVKTEAEEVVQRLQISDTNMQQIFRKVEVIELKLEKARVAEEFVPYVFDEEDSHVVAGALKSTARFLLTHNLKHYRTEKIKQDFDIITMKPGMFLQYLRRN